MINIKICGLTRDEDIEIINQYKPEFIGFVFAKSKRQVSVETAVALKSKLSEDIKTVGVFVDYEKEHMVQILNDEVIDIAQLHGNEDEDYIVYIKEKTKKPVIKAISVCNIDDVLAWSNSQADYLLFDNGKGGTGKKFDWEIIKSLEEIKDFDKPFFIAGGLNIENVKTAISYKPFGVDVSSGVEEDGIKNRDKIKEFINRVRK